MDDLHLILHKVRGEPAFDVAICLGPLLPDGDECWIIPTSGHRAYPFCLWPFTELPPHIWLDNLTKTLMESPSFVQLRDHYAATNEGASTPPQRPLAARPADSLGDLL